MNGKGEGVGDTVFTSLFHFFAVDDGDGRGVLAS